MEYPTLTRDIFEYLYDVGIYLDCRKYTGEKRIFTKGYSTMRMPIDDAWELITCGEYTHIWIQDKPEKKWNIQP